MRTTCATRVSTFDRATFDENEDESMTSRHDFWGKNCSDNFRTSSELKSGRSLKAINPILSITKHGTIKKEQLLNRGKSMVAKAKK